MPTSGTDGKTETAPLDRRKLAFFRKALLSWERGNFARFPWRFTRNRFHALIAEVMLQRTKADQVVPVYSEFVRRYPSPAVAANEKPGVLEALLKPLGLAWRARIVRALAKALAQRRGSVPTGQEALRELPGVGDYAAAAFCTFHLRQPVRLIDANIVRLFGRYFGFETGPETRRARWFRVLAQRVQPRKDAKAFGYALLDFTRAICTPRPRCDICPLRRRCTYAMQKGLNAKIIG